MKKVISIVKYVHSDSLYRNSFYLMASTFVMSFLGFFFWMINTRLYSSEQIGLATTLMSVMSFITSFSMLGFYSVLVRFLPTAENKNDIVNTAFTIISITTLLVTIIFILGLPVFSPRLLFIRNSPIFILSFSIFMIIASINAITDSVFIAFRNTKYILFINSIISIVKLISTFFLFALGAYGIFYSIVISINLATVLSLIFIAFLFKIYFFPEIKMNVVKKVWRYSFGNYLANFINMVPSLIMPIIITNNLGPKYTAYYYMPSMIVSLLLAVPVSTTSSLFAEGSYKMESIKIQAFKTLKIITVILIPTILFLIFFGRYILLFFGKEYSIEGYNYMRLILISVAISIPKYLISTILNIKHQVNKIIITNFIGCIFSLSLSLLLINRGLIGLGYSSILSQTFIILIFSLFYLKIK